MSEELLAVLRELGIPLAQLTAFLKEMQSGRRRAILIYTGLDRRAALDLRDALSPGD